MSDITTERLRNIVLLSHSGAGKTILAEALLNAAGVTSRTGTIEEGNTASDYEPEEARRQSSVQLSVLPCPWRGHKINVIDTPGYADFRGETISGVRVADGAVIVVSAPADIEVGTRQMWQLASDRELKKMVFVNKMNRENADFQRVMDSISEAFGKSCIPITVPLGAEADFSGVVDLLDPSVEVPESVKGQIEAARERLTEAVAETDDDLTMKYLEGETLTQEELTNGLKKAVASGVIVPVLAGAATSGAGVKELMDAVVDYMPSPADVEPASATESSSEKELSLACDSGGPLAALAFKTSADPFVGKLSYFRVYSGTLSSDSQVLNFDSGQVERVGQLYQMTGKAQEGVPRLVAGDIGVVAKLSSVMTGNTLCANDHPVTLPSMEFPRPVYQMAASPKSKADVDKMNSSLARISEEDPSLAVDREPDTLEVLLGGLGDTHVEVAVEKMKRKFGVDIALKVPKVPYKETIGTPTKVEYKHKKQSGGHGQYGHVWLEIEPMSKGSGFEFASAIVGGVVPREYIPAVHKGVQKALGDGVVAGFPIVDLKATLVDGSYHSVDSSGVAFEIAARQALIKGVQQATPVLLEPIMHAEVTVPEGFTGEVIGDLNSKRGQILGMTPLGDGTTLVDSEVPQAEMLRYATELRSITQGLGSFTIEFGRYEVVPQHLVERVVESLKDTEELEEARA